MTIWRDIEEDLAAIAELAGRARVASDATGSGDSQGGWSELEVILEDIVSRLEGPLRWCREHREADVEEAARCPRPR